LGQETDPRTVVRKADGGFDPLDQEHPLGLLRADSRNPIETD
jgi:hypothetical protein